MIFIFDLDGTVIDTSHRYRNLPCGKIDLDYWRANCVAEKIALDTLLPLAEVMRRYYAEGHTIVVCTARVCNEHDMAFMANNNLPYHHFLSRDADDMRSDGPYKVAKLDDWAASQGLSSDWTRGALMFDDNATVIDTVYRERRLFCFDAVRYNERLRGEAINLFRCAA